MVKARKNGQLVPEIWPFEYLGHERLNIWILSIQLYFYKFYNFEISASKNSTNLNLDSLEGKYSKLGNSKS